MTRYETTPGMNPPRKVVALLLAVRSAVGLPGAIRRDLQRFGDVVEYVAGGDVGAQHGVALEADRLLIVRPRQNPPCQADMTRETNVAMLVEAVDERGLATAHA
jgi:hypothetical protein